MNFRWGTAAGSALLAAGALLVAAYLVRGAPLLGVGGFSRAVSAMLGEDSGPVDREPVRVSLGVERARAPGSGPRPALDPASVRRPPGIEDGWEGLAGEGLAACAAVLAPERREATDAMRVRPPGFAARGPSSFDRRAAGDALALDVKAHTRPLPARFSPGPPASLANAAGAARPSLGARDALIEFPFDRSPPEPPAGWPVPDRPLGRREMFVDAAAAAP